ncbi:hypothetical protein [Rhodovarius lipocyclicus]|uniref:hypothetical protein n=1 Tax=Rhodovarius lipocyclicus TaxID=268410 RepID=UPI001356B6C0|nr:hypothetical protein [Rhodovarius lipocyclicus]
MSFLPPKPDAGSHAPDALRAHTREIAAAVRVVMQGGLNAVLDVELGTGTSTEVRDDRLTFSGAGLFDPLDATAAADLAGGGVYVAQSDRLNRRWVITHPAGPAGRRFRLLVIG